MRVKDRVGTWVSGTLAAIAGLVVTFWSDHSPAAGALVFGVWATATAVVTWLYATQPGQLLARVRAAVTAMSAGACLLVPLSAAGLAALIGLWALLSAALEFARLRQRGSARLGFEIVLYLLLALSQLLSGANSVVVVGLLGAYLVVVAVWQLIAAASPAEQASATPAGDARA